MTTYSSGMTTCPFRLTTCPFRMTTIFLGLLVLLGGLVLSGIFEPFGIITCSFGMSACPFEMTTNLSSSITQRTWNQILLAYAFQQQQQQQIHKDTTPFSKQISHHLQSTQCQLMFQVSHPCVCLLVQRSTHFSDMILRVICTTQLPYRFLLLVQGLNSPCSYSVHVQIKSHRLEMSYWSWIYFRHQKAESAVSAPLLPQEMAHMHEE